MTDFERAMGKAWAECSDVRIEWNECDVRWQAYTHDIRSALNALAAAHAVVVAERDSYRDVAHKLARYVLPDSDTLTIRQLVDAADAVCEAAEEGDDVD